MKVKIIPDDIKNKTINELREMANKIIQKIETKNDLENSLNDYQELIKLNHLIEKKFYLESKKISQATKEKIEKIKSNK